MLLVPDGRPSRVLTVGCNMIFRADVTQTNHVLDVSASVVLRHTLDFLVDVAKEHTYVSESRLRRAALRWSFFKLVT